MEKILRICGLLFPVLYLISMLILVERMIPGWVGNYFSFEEQCISERVFLIPVITFVLVAGFGFFTLVEAEKVRSSI